MKELKSFCLKKTRIGNFSSRAFEKEVLLKSDVERLIGPSPYHKDKHAEPQPLSGQHVSDEKPEADNS